MFSSTVYTKNIFGVSRNKREQNILCFAKKGSTFSFLTFRKDVRFFFYQAHKFKVETTGKATKTIWAEIDWEPLSCTFAKLETQQVSCHP